MKVILLQDVQGTGKKWEVKEIKGGYGRNYLLNRNLAVLATESNLKDIKSKQIQEEQKKALREDLLLKSLESLKEDTLVIEKKANEKGHLYDALDVKEIAELIAKKLKAEIPVEYVKLEKPIKEIGRHKITIRKGERKISVEIEIKEDKA